MNTNHFCMPGRIQALVRCCLLFLGLVVNNSHAVDISPHLINSEGESYKEYPANLWFLLDDSGSMGFSDLTHYYMIAADLYIYYGFIPYDRHSEYQLPNDIHGNPMPLPPLGKIYLQPFLDMAQNIQPAPVHIGQNNIVYRNSNAQNIAITSCQSRESTAEKRRNCQIWLNYYRTRLDVLKSSLSLNLFGLANQEKTENIRVGFTSLNNNIDSTTDKDQVLPVLPFYGNQEQANKAKFNRWLFQLYANSGTPLRGKASKLYQEIITQSSASNSGYIAKNNPFLQHPGKDPSQNNNIRTCRRNYALLLTDGAWNTTSETAVTNHLSTPDYIKQATTEENDTLPDGKTYTAKSPYRKHLTSIFGAQPRTLADIAFAGWKTDLDDSQENNNLMEKQPLIKGKIASLHGSPYWHPYNDPANWQHINTFTIGFGLPGNARINPPEDGKPGIDPNFLAETFSWQIRAGSRSINEQSATYDLANAAVASRGRFYNVKTANDLSRAFKNIIRIANTENKPARSASSGALGGSKSTGIGYFATNYSPDSFMGELAKYAVYNGTQDNCTTTNHVAKNYGQICDNPIWEAGKTLTARYGNNPSSRKVLSIIRQDDGKPLTASDNRDNLTLDTLNYLAINFTKDALSERQKHTLITHFPETIINAFNNNQTRLQKLINYIRGDKSEEDSGNFRSRYYRYNNDDLRRNILGAIVRSTPVYSGVPQLGSLHPKRYDNSYLNFMKRYLYDSNGQSACQASCSNPVEKDNVDMIYVGANDGMLHAFKATSGEEAFAYIPNAVYRNLPKLVENDLTTSFVDGNLNIQTTDLTLGGQTQWRKMLVGAMGGGAKGLYTLDVTNPHGSHTIPQWEYSELESQLYQKTQNAQSPTAKPSHIGNILAKPAMVQLSDGTWAVIVGNGYNSESQKAALIVIDLATGKPIQELVLDNPYTDSHRENGLGGVFFVSASGKPIEKGNRVDRAYAGDLQGNLWVFDLSQATKNGHVKLAQSKPLFVARSPNNKIQPITATPLVQNHPSGSGYLVHLGTGSLLAIDDLSQNTTQSIYAIWDNLDSQQINPTQLKTIEFIPRAGYQANTKDGKKAVIREIDPTTTAINWKAQKGWRINLSEGERAWQTPYLTQGSHHVGAISYNTTQYQPPQGNLQSCFTADNGLQSWKLAFNASDATQPLPVFGTLDSNRDGQIDSNDLIVKAPKAIVASGVKYDNQILFNPTTINQYLPLTATQPSQRLCTFSTDITQTSDGQKLAQQICRYSTASSWSELK